MMNLRLLDQLIERLRKEAIGDPKWVDAKETFEYQPQSIEVVMVLKLVRAAQGIHALDLLCRAGLFVDMGVIYRCVADCSSEVYFLLEKYPDRSGLVDKFIKEFFSRTTDGHLYSEEEPVPTKKIHSAMVRTLANGQQNEKARQSIDRIYKTFSGYTHASYAHIMQMYGGPRLSLSFNISGVSSQMQRENHMQLVQVSHQSLLFTMSHVALKLGLRDLYRDIRKASQEAAN